MYINSMIFYQIFSKEIISPVIEHLVQNITQYHPELTQNMAKHYQIKFGGKHILF